MLENLSDPPAGPSVATAPQPFAAAKMALYRRYRPESFADVIGQEHVTDPLMRALDNNRIGHAYLFSGPRGCGKTTSARILARCLNCAAGPTSTPCGTCASCVELSRGGSGSLDVVEIDAASHGGVDDARELRERAAFAPARDRYKIFILDEAHMVTAHGFNALLKLVEEPPAHVKFIFATTEPEKVIGTIRSRTHHYPFRLIPATVLTRYLEHLCESEGVPVEKGVLPLVVRAGTGSARDTLSVLDQLMAGSAASGISYQTAVNLLGFTDGELLDSIVDALSAGDAATVFQMVDRVVGTGHDPRRFVEDLLDRLRDLIIAAAVPDALESLLPGSPGEYLDRLRQQASVFGAAALSRAADVTNAGLNEMHGPTSPRIQLELLCARLLLPGTDAGSAGGLASRVDRIERRLGASANNAPNFPAPNSGGYAAPESQRGVSGENFDVPEGMSAREMARQAARRKPQDASVASASAAGRVTAVAPVAPVVAQAVQAGQAESAPSTPPTPGGQPTSEAATSLGALDTVAIRTAWPNILERLSDKSRLAWSALNNYGQVLRLSGDTLTVAFSQEGAMRYFHKQQADTLLEEAVFEELGLRVRTEIVTGQQVQVVPAQPLASTVGQRPARAPQYSQRPQTREVRAPNGQSGPSNQSNQSAQSATFGQAASATPTSNPAEQQLGYDEWPDVAQPPTDTSPPTGPIPVQNFQSVPTSAHLAPVPAPSEVFHDEEPLFVQEYTNVPDDITAPEAESYASAGGIGSGRQPKQPTPASLAPTAPPAPPVGRAKGEPTALMQRLAAKAGETLTSPENFGTAGTDPWLARNPQDRPEGPPRPAPGTEVPLIHAQPETNAQNDASTAQIASAGTAPGTTPDLAPASENRNESLANVARAALNAAHQAKAERGSSPRAKAPTNDDAYHADPDDPTLDGLTESGPEVVKQLLGGEIIEELASDG